jgi:hypothetical protein
MPDVYTVGLLLIASLFLLATRAESAELVINGGQLQGATSVSVDGTLYDVEFVDGECPSLFNGCNAASDFAAGSRATATLFAQTLRDQILVDGSQGNFGSDPRLAVGCGTGVTQCIFFIPFDVDSANSLSVWLYNNATGADTILSTVASTPFGFATSSGSLTWARWTLHSAPAVPSASSPVSIGLTLLIAWIGQRSIRTLGESPDAEVASAAE